VIEKVKYILFVLAKRAGGECGLLADGQAFFCNKLT
jgi:hypothetical protein